MLFRSLGIVLFHRFIKRWIECQGKIKSKFVKSFLEVFLVSFAAQILIVPIMIYCFNTISLTFFVSNLMIYFLIGPILAIGYISVIIGLAFPPIGSFLAIFEKFLVMLIFKVAEICSRLPFSKIYLPTPDFWMLILYYIAIAGIVYLFQTRKMRFLRFLLGDGIQNFCKKYYKKMLLSIVTVVILANIIGKIPRNLRVYFVDVGQR